MLDDIDIDALRQEGGSMSAVACRDPETLRRALGVVRHRTRRLLDADRLDDEARDSLRRIAFLCAALGVRPVDEPIGADDPLAVG